MGVREDSGEAVKVVEAVNAAEAEDSVAMAEDSVAMAVPKVRLRQRKSRRHNSRHAQVHTL